MSMLSKVHTGYVYVDMESVHKSRPQCMTFIFVLDHSEIKGNERADSKSRKTSMVYGSTVGQADILSVF